MSGEYIESIASAHVTSEGFGFVYIGTDDSQTRLGDHLMVFIWCIPHFPISNTFVHYTR